MLVIYLGIHILCCFILLLYYISQGSGIIVTSIVWSQTLWRRNTWSDFRVCSDLDLLRGEELRDTFKVFGLKSGFMGCPLTPLVEFAACRPPHTHPVSYHLFELSSKNLLRTVHVSVLLTRDVPIRFFFTLNRVL